MISCLGTRERASRVPQPRCKSGFARYFVSQGNACVTRFADVRDTEIALHTVDGFEPFNASTALTRLTNPAIAFPLDVGHLARRNISFERTEAADSSFPSL